VKIGNHLDVYLSHTTLNIKTEQETSRLSNESCRGCVCSKLLS